MVAAISAGASSTSAPHLQSSDDSVRRLDAANHRQYGSVSDLQSVIVDISDEGIELSRNEAATRAQEVLAMMDVNLDGKLSVDQFSVVDAST